MPEKRNMRKDMFNTRVQAKVSGDYIYNEQSDEQRTEYIRLLREEKIKQMNGGKENDQHKGR